MPIANYISFCLLVAVVITAAVYDCRTQKIPNRLNYLSILLGFALALILPLITDNPDIAFSRFQSSLIAFFAALIPFTIIFAMGALGGGDVKLFAAVGAISCSWQTVMATAIYSFLFVFIMAIIVMVKKRIIRQTLTRIFHACFGFLLRNKPTMPEDSPRLPMGLAIALGSIIAASETLLAINWPWTSMIYP